MQIIPYSTEIAPQLQKFFPGSYPVPTRLAALLDGTIQGRILVDEPANPTFAFLQDLTEGNTYLGGIMKPQTLVEAFTLLRSYQDLVVCLWHDSPLLSALPSGPDYRGTAIDFTDRSPAVNLDLLAEIPSGYHIEKIDEKYAKAVEGFGYYVKMFGRPDLAVQSMIGYYLMQGETIVCEAVAAPLTRGLAEMGVGTVEAYQKKGLATVTAAYVIRECEALGYRPFWNAAQQNKASIALARKLGFQKEQPFTVLAWSETNRLS